LRPRAFRPQLKRDPLGRANVAYEHLPPPRPLFGDTSRDGLPAFRPLQRPRDVHSASSDTLEEVLFCIPNPISEGTPDAANVLVQIRPAPKIPNFHRYTDSLFAIVTTGEVHLVLTDTTDADHVRTIFWQGQQGATPYAIADIFGVTRRLAIYVRTALPLLKRMPADWLPRVTGELNGFLGSFVVDGVTLLPRIQAVADSLR